MFYHPLVFTMIPAKSVQLSFCEFLLVLRWQCVPGHHMVSLLSSTLSHGHRSTLSGSDMAQVANYFFCVHLIEFILRIWTYLIAEVTFSELGFKCVKLRVLYIVKFIISWKCSETVLQFQFPRLNNINPNTFFGNIQIFASNLHRGVEKLCMERWSLFLLNFQRNLQNLIIFQAWDWSRCLGHASFRWPHCD